MVERVGRGDPQSVADHRPGTRAAGRDPDALLPDVGHDLADGEEIRVVVQLGDHIEFFVQPVKRHPVAVEATSGHARLGLAGAATARLLRSGLGAEERRFREVRRAQPEVRHRIDDACGRRGNGVRHQAPCPPDIRSGALGDHLRDDRHRPFVLEPTLPAVQTAPVDRAQQPRGVQDISKPMLVRVGVAGSVGEHCSGVGAVGQRQGPGCQPKRTGPDAGTFMHNSFQPDSLAEDLPPRCQQLGRDVFATSRQGPHRLRERSEQHGQAGAAVLA